MDGRRRSPERLSQLVRGTEKFQGRTPNRQEQTAMEVVQGRCLGVVRGGRSSVRTSFGAWSGVGVRVGVLDTRAETEAVEG